MVWSRWLPFLVLLLVVSAHTAYLSRYPTIREEVVCVLDEKGRCVDDRVVQKASTPLSLAGFKNYLQNQDYFLGLAYALAFAFATYALMQWRNSRRQALAGAAFGLGLGSALWAGTCFLVGCCGSPMLSVWLGLFGTQAVGLTKPSVTAITALSVGCGYLCLRRKTCC